MAVEPRTYTVPITRTYLDDNPDAPMLRVQVDVGSTPPVGMAKLSRFVDLDLPNPTDDEKTAYARGKSVIVTLKPA